MSSSDLDPFASISPETRVSLFNDFTFPEGPAIMLSNHYYFTGRPGNSQEPIEKDPLQRLKWNQNNLPYFSAVAKGLRQLRNNLVHHNLITVGHILKLEKALDKLKTTNPTNFLIGVLIDRLIAAQKIEWNMKYYEKIGGISFGMRDLPPEMKDPAGTSVNYQLSQIKANLEMKTWIKGKEVTISSGKYFGLTGRFRSWSGTMCFIDFPELGKKSISVDNYICFDGHQ